MLLKFKSHTRWQFIFQLRIFFLCRVIRRNFCGLYSFSLPDGYHGVKRLTRIVLPTTPTNNTEVNHQPHVSTLSSKYTLVLICVLETLPEPFSHAYHALPFSHPNLN